MTGKKAVIIGGSIAGLFAGIRLIQRGWETTIIEKSKHSLASRGTGIARHSELEDLLDYIGIQADDTVGINVAGRTAFDRRGAITNYYELPQRLGAWNRVFEPLAAAFPAECYLNAESFEDVHTEEGTTIVRTSTGLKLDADIVIGADGFGSEVRRFVDPACQPVYGGYVAWRGVSEERDLSQRFTEEIFSHYAFLFTSQSLLIGYPMAGADGSVEEGRRRYNYLWYFPVSSDDLADMLTDAEGTVHEQGIPPPLMRPETFERLHSAAADRMPKNFQEAVFRASSTIFQAIYDVRSDHIYKENITLIGDAAFVARPHVGVGVLKAAQDAVALAETLGDCGTVPKALERYSSERLGPGQRAVDHGRLLGNFIERGLDSPEDDPALNLPIARIIKVSGRPYEHVMEQSL